MMPQGSCQIFKRNFHDFSMSFQGYFANFSMIFLSAAFQPVIPNVRLSMTFTGSGGAEIIQLNPVESHIQGTAFLNYSIVLEQ